MAEAELDEGQATAPHDNDKMKRVPLRERSRQWFLTMGTVLALLATIIGFLSDSVGVLEFLRGSEAMPAPTQNAAKVVLDQLVTDTPAPTQTPFPTPTATSAVSRHPPLQPCLSSLPKMNGC